MSRLKPPVHWSQQMKNFVEAYPLDEVMGISDETAIAHAIQKDAIQNSLDAMIDKDEFSVTFEVDDLVNPSYVSITDKGTTGLTGEPALRRSELERMGSEKYRNEKWSRFQSLGYTHPDVDKDMLGARGQGKFIFIGGSETKEIIFDSLRDDGVYRVGHWETGKNDPLMEPLESQEAEDYLNEEIGLDPLEEVGTRIVIPNPKPELYTSLRGIYGENSDLRRYISSTWWDALNNGLTVEIGVKGEENIEVKPPNLYQRFWDNPNSFKYWSKESTGKPFADENLPGCEVEELIIVRTEEKVPPTLRGIALTRRGMTVERMKPTYGNPQIPQMENEHIFGWIILNQEVERQLRKAEKSSHYHFDLRKGRIPKLLFGRKGWISEQMERFGEKELGWGTTGEDITSTQSKVLNTLNHLARDAGYEKPATVGGSRGKEESEEPVEESKKRGTYISPIVRLEYPTEGTRRVEFGETVSNIKARVANYHNVPKTCKFRLSLNKKDGYRRENENVRFTIAKEEIEVPPGEKTDWYGPSSVTFNEDTYEEGTYVVHALLANPKTGDKIREERKLIYLNRNPPLKWGVFKEIEAKTFEPPQNKLMFNTRVGKDKKITLVLNDKHPLFEKFSKRGKPTPEYTLLCGTNALLDRDLQKDGKLVAGEESVAELMEADEMFGEIVGHVSEKRQEILHEAFK